MRLLHDHPRHRQLAGEPAHMRLVLGVDAAGVAVALVFVDRAQGVESPLEIARPVDRQDRGELLARERMRPACASFLHHQAFRVDQRGARQAGDRADLLHGLRGDGGRELAAGEHRFLQRLFFRRAQQGPAFVRQRGDHPVVDLVVHDHRVLGGAARRVVENLGGHDLPRRIGAVGAVVHDHRHVAGADAQGRLAAGVARAHVALRSGHDDQVGLLHQRVGELLRDRRRQVLHQPRRRADPRELLVHEGEQQRAGAVALRGGGDDDRVAAFQRVDDVVRGRRSRVGRGHDRRHHAHGSRDLGDAPLRVFRDDAGGFRTLQVAQQSQRFPMVLGHLVGNGAQAGVLDRELGQRLVALGIHDRPARCGRRLVELRLRRALENLLRGARARDQAGYHVARGGACAGGLGGASRHIFEMIPQELLLFCDGAMSFHARPILDGDWDFHVAEIRARSLALKRMMDS